MEGADESTELWLHPVDEMAIYVNLSAVCSSNLVGQN